MEYRYLGRTGLRVSELCLGTMTFGRESDEATSQQILDRFVAAGVRRVVDLGCGIGADALALLDAGLEVVAVDSDPETASIARANLDDRAEVFCPVVRRDGAP